MADVIESPGTYQPLNAISAPRSANQSDMLPERIQHWRKDILKDMTSLPKVKGRKPGRIVVFGDLATPILSGPRNEHVVIAAAELGPKKGRVVVLSHHRYLQQFCVKTDQEELAVLQENINHWLTKGEFANKDQITHLNDKEDLSQLPEGTKLLIWDSSCSDASEELEEDVLKFVKNGGGLAYAICPYRWQENNQDKLLNEVPLGGILASLGIGFCASKIPYGSPKGILVDSKLGGPIQALSHAQFLINTCCTETKETDLQQHAIKFVQYFRDVPVWILNELKEKLQRLFAKCKEVTSECIPTDDQRVTDLKTIAMLSICGALSEIELGHSKMPGLHHFLGEIPEDAKTLECTKLSLKSQGYEAHPTGYWVPAGTTCEITVVNQMASCKNLERSSSAEEIEPEPDDEEDDLDEWAVRIGCHSDTLYHKDVLKRLPNLVIKTRLGSKLRIFTPYGGLLYFISPRALSEISVQISGVIAAPYFDLKDPECAEKWEKSKDAPGPWADVCGQWFHVTVPSSAVRDLADPGKVLKVWDNIVLQNHDLRGTRPQRREWLVADVQPVVGKMHSGYPLVANMKIAEPDGALSYERLTTVGFWGIFHELGHNMQRNMWTFEGTREVTCNIFALYAAEHTAGQKLWIHDWLKRHLPKIKEYLDDGAEFSEWQQHHGVALGFYAQLANCFGWQVYKRVFWRYEITPLKRRPTTTQDRIDEWVLRFSDATGYNVVPIAEFWGIPVSPQAQQKVKPLKAFLPDDEMTRMAEKRVKVLLKKYPGMARIVDKEKIKLDKHWCPIV